jgi:hypothetical protein
MRGGTGMTLPEAFTPAERRLIRLIYEALLRRLDPDKGPWWYPLEEAIGIPLGSINPGPPKMKPQQLTDADLEEFSRTLKNLNTRPVNDPA